MMVDFSPAIRIKSFRARIEGLRHQPFVNINGQPFGRPTMGGFWRVDMELVAGAENELLALNSFLTSMTAAGTTCLLPVVSDWLPNDGMGRRLVGYSVGNPTLTHEGFAGDPFDGYWLIEPASARDSYIDVAKPALSHLRPGHMVTLGERLHQVVNVNAIGEREDRVRVSVMPNLRESYPVGTLVVVDQLRLRCALESGDPPDLWNIPYGTVSAKFVEAF